MTSKKLSSVPFYLKMFLYGFHVLIFDGWMFSIVWTFFNYAFKMSLAAVQPAGKMYRPAITLKRQQFNKILWNIGRGIENLNLKLTWGLLSRIVA